MSLQARRDYEKAAPELPKRGEIEGFSAEAARRCREAFMRLHVPGFDLWAVTLTTHAAMTPAQWRVVMKRFRMALRRSGWAGVWRVELQRRKAPHAHVALWIPRDAGLQDVIIAWLRATGEFRDQAAVAHAVRGSQISASEAGWAIYMALHNGKKGEQLGWLGKQWGVWNRDLLRERDPDRFELTPGQHVRFLRVLRHLEKANRRRHVRDLERMCTPHGDQKAAGILARGKVRPLHQGNLLRCMNGATVRQLVDAIHDGRIMCTDQGAGAK